MASGRGAAQSVSQLGCTQLIHAYLYTCACGGVVPAAPSHSASGATPPAPSAPTSSAVRLASMQYAALTGPRSATACCCAWRTSSDSTWAVEGQVGWDGRVQVQPWPHGAIQHPMAGALHQSRERSQVCTCAVLSPACPAQHSTCTFPQHRKQQQQRLRQRQRRWQQHRQWQQQRSSKQATASTQAPPSAPPAARSWAGGPPPAAPAAHAAAGRPRTGRHRRRPPVGLP